MLTPASVQTSAHPRAGEISQITRRIVDAATAPRLHTTAPNSPFNWRPGGENLPEAQTDDGADAEPLAPPTSAASSPWGEGTTGATSKTNPATKEENHLDKTPAAAPPRNLQRRLAEVLAEAPLTRAKLAACFPEFNSTQISNGLFNLSAVSRVERFESVDGNAFRLTKRGRDWLAASGAEPAEKKRRAKTVRKAAATKRPRKPTARTPRQPRAKPIRRKAAAKTSNGATSRALSVPVDQIIVAQPSFRCAVFSDGGFALAKNGVEIALDREEHAHMLRYLERMAEEPAAA